MTGYGRGESEGWIFEIRSVNHRFCDIHFRLPRRLASLEVLFTKEIKKWIKRGRLEVTCLSDHPARMEGGTLALDEDLLDQVYRQFVNLKRRYGIHQEINLDHLSSFHELFRITEEATDGEHIREEVLPALKAALAAIDRMRVLEGENLKRGLASSLEKISEIRRKLIKRSPEVVEYYKEKLRDRMGSLLPGEGLDEGRLMQEAALFADRSDITEELDRLGSHLQQFRAMLEEAGPHGRRMDFLLQEMNREINTIGAKGNDLMISQWVVTCKSELEKLREQVQNIE